MKKTIEKIINETIKIRLTATDFPELPKTITKIKIDGEVKWVGANKINYSFLGEALYASSNIYSYDKEIAKIINQNFPKIQTKETQIRQKISQKYFGSKSYYQSSLLEIIWNEGIELEFEVEEEKIFPAL